MSLWEIANSPIVLTFVSLIWGSLVASRVTALWQKRSYRHQIKLQYAQEIVNLYQEYLRTIRSEKTKLSQEDFDKIHPRMLSSAKLIHHLFINKKIGEDWLDVASKLSSIYDLRLQKRDGNLIERKLREIYPEVDEITEVMFNELV